MVSEPSFWNPNPFWPPLIQAITHSGQIFLAISQSDHLSLSLSLSFRSSVPVLRAKGENAFRSVESSSENIHRRQLFRRTSRRTFFLHRKDRLEEISNFAQSTGARKPSMRRPRTFFRPATASHAPAREGAWATFRRRASSSGSPDADQPPFLPVFAIRALHVHLLGFFCLRGPSDQFFQHPPAIFSQLQSLHVPWKVFFYLSGPWQNTEWHHHKYPASRHQNQGADLKFQTLVAVIPLLFSSQDTN